MIEAGSPAPLGAHVRDGGVNFAVHSAAAERVELCLFDADNRQTTCLDFTERTGAVWHGFLPGCASGQRYGYRAHGVYAPEQGLRCNPAKLLVDPYARELSGRFSWSPDVFDFQSDGDERRISPADSAPHIPKGIVVGNGEPLGTHRPDIPWSEMILYEANVRGYTMRHPDLPELDRGTFRGMSNGNILRHLSALGITTIELMPVFEFIDEQFLHRQGLRNYWGYNSVNFFCAGRTVRPRQLPHRISRNGECDTRRRVRSHH